MNELMQNLLKLQVLEFSSTKDKHSAKMIAELRGKIPAPVLSHYDRLRVRGKKGLAALNNQVCTGCHMGVPIGVLMTLKHGLDLQLCDSCGRYLYLAVEADKPAVIEPVAAKAVPAKRRRKKAGAAD